MVLRNYSKEFKTNLKLAAPIMMGQLGQVLVGLVDNLMVGDLGAAPLAAISLGNGLVFIALAIGLGFSFALTPLIAEMDGKQDVEGGRRYFHHGIVLCAVSGVVLCTFLFIAKPVLYHLNQPAEVVELALPYLNIVALSMIPLMIFQAFKQFADGLSQTRYAMYATLIANAVNVVFNYLLIYGIWIFPKLALEGAAIGTLISRFFMLIFLFLIFKKKEKFIPYLQWSSKERFEKSIFKRILILGFPTALQVLFEVAIFTASIFLAGSLGTHPQAANQIALNLASMTFMIAFGLGVAATIRVGNQKGMGAYSDLRRIAFSIFMLVLLIEVCFAFGFVILKDVLPGWYIDNAEVVSIAIDLLLIAAWFQVSDGMQTVILGALRGFQDVKIPTIICFVAYWVIGFPLCYYLSQHTVFGVRGIWIGLLLGLTISAVLLYVRFNYLSKKMIRNTALE